jgi:murein DD-endopeptidase MepM/ murein hydrolase activator NlpD
MNSLVELFDSWPQAIALAFISIGAAGCSADSARFGEGPRAQGEVTGSIPVAQGAVGHVESGPLPQTSQLPPPQAPAASALVAGGGRGMASYSPPAASYNPPAPASYNPPPSPATYNPAPAPVAYGPTTYAPAPPDPAPTPKFTGSVGRPPSLVRKPSPSAQWSRDGGTAVTVAPGETVDSIARRYGVPATVIMEANKLPSAKAIRAGQRLVIPRYGSATAAAPAAPAPPSSHLVAPAAPPAVKPASPVLGSVAPRPASQVSSGVHVVATGDTLTKIAHQYRKSLAEITKANNVPPDGKLTIGDRIIIPGPRVSSAAPEAEPAGASFKPAGNKVAANTATAPSTGVQSASMVTPAAAASGADSVVKAATEDTPGFRWPVRGRIIAGFGPKPNGQQNDGIDVAVPENTPIKAAEGGVVAYAGNELKGYGNLVLVKHPNGYVTAYANAKELLVKRGDQIKRGDVIAKSGQSGNVDAPQVHFEVRKGSAPVDPMQFLNGA